ncbi:hypothetical protein QR680_017218 [Steinernema hermaphroditum]|uniref:Uncharacterized protein n=1 Tax=Steinernema hermaphroditum TaxID=289476 RepID=A0AA39HDS3_9BILA|nr:hypothetical protein QR680_017218 [Steinernema hermaphroditum]
MAPSLLAIAVSGLRDDATFAQTELLPRELRRILLHFLEDVEAFEAAFRRLLPWRRLPSRFIAIDRGCRLDVEETVQNFNGAIAPSAFVALCTLNLMESDYRAAPKPETLVLDFLMYPMIHRGVPLYAGFLRRGRFRADNATATLVFLARSGFERLFELFFVENSGRSDALTVLRRCVHHRVALRVLERTFRRRKNGLHKCFGPSSEKGAILEELRRHPGIIAASGESAFVATVTRLLMAEVGAWQLEKLDRWIGEFPSDVAESVAYCRLRYLE